MVPTRRRNAPLAAVALALTLALAASARDDDEDEVEEKPPENSPQFAMADANFDAWVFGQAGTGDRRDWLATRLQLHLDEVDRLCHLSEAQQAKLRLAARGDIKHFYDLVEVMRGRFQLVKNDQAKFQDWYQELQPLTKRFNSMFTGGSRFARTVRATLTPEQGAAYDRARRERLAYRHRAKVELAIGMLGGVSALTEVQQRRLVDLLVAETRPPGGSGTYDYYYVLYRAAHVPEEKLRPIFDEAQWRVIRPQLATARGYEPFLKQAGFLDPVDGEEPDPGPGKAEAGR